MTKAINEFKLSKNIAIILARRYYDGTRDKNNVKSMTWTKYRNISLINWIFAANGIIHLVKKELKNLT